MVQVIGFIAVKHVNLPHIVTRRWLVGVFVFKNGVVGSESIRLTTLFMKKNTQINQQRAQHGGHGHNELSMTVHSY